jgi:hypothetical protein
MKNEVFFYRKKLLDEKSSYRMIGRLQASCAKPLKDFLYDLMLGGDRSFRFRRLRSFVSRDRTMLRRWRGRRADVSGHLRGIVGAAKIN